MHFARPGILMLLIAVATLAFAMTLLAASNHAPPSLTYPKAKTVDQVDDYHGTKVADPYRGLEDTDSADTRAWIEEENKVTFHYLEQIPYRQAIHDRLKTLWNYERYGVPEQQGGRYFYQHNTGLQNQSVLLVADSVTAEPRLLLDPNITLPRTARLRWWARRYG
jgi:prolyl oligopeptidase